MGTPKRVDANQAVCVRGMRQIGAQVHCTHELGHGYPDLCVVFRGEVYLIEVKLPGCQLTPDERKWHEDNKAPNIGICYGPEDCLRFIGAIE